MNTNNAIKRTPAKKISVPTPVTMETATEVSRVEAQPLRTRGTPSLLGNATLFFYCKYREERDMIDS